MNAHSIMGLKKGIKKILTRLTTIFLRFFTKHKSLISLYYAFFSGAFREEQQAVLYGRSVYAERARNFQNPYLFRRNIHRLEKGLTNALRRDPFGLDYIDETVRTYERLLKEGSQNSLRNSELRWAFCVLSQYFNLASPHPTFAEAKSRFASLPRLSENTTDYGPFQRPSASSASVSHTAFRELAQRRKSIRKYLPQPVPRILIDQAVEVAGFSPSACNRQPFEFRIFDEPEWIKKVASLPGGIADFEKNIPVLVVVIGKLSAFEAENDRHLIYLDGALASMTFMLALETLGLGSCPINWPEVTLRERKMEDLLRLQPEERPILLITLGYPDPDGWIAYSQRKPLAALRRYNG